ncbi:MAG: hypothetical protein V4494_01230 [Chlamydiota bacterium]
MNILPLIISSLLIMACVSASFFRERQSTIWEERSYLGFMRVERKARAQIASARYKKAPKKKNNPKKPAKNQTHKTSTFVNRRERNELTELSKLNIGPLFLKPSKELYEITARLIKELYKDAPFFKKSTIKRVEYLIVDSMIEHAKNNKKAVDLVEFFPEDTTLHSIFYKMVKGTHGNYPPLGEYLAIDLNTNRKPINFSFASIPLLTVIFGKTATQAVLEKEHKKWEEDHKQHRLSKDDLTSILDTQKNLPFNLYKVQHFFDFSRTPASKKHITAQDPKTQITTTKEL